MREQEVLIEARQLEADGLHRDAEHLLEAGQLAYPKSAPIRRDLALLHRKRGVTRLARTVLKEAIELSPASIALKLLYIELSREGGALEDAVATADRLLDQEGLDTTALRTLGTVYALAGHRAQLIRCLARLAPEAHAELDVAVKLAGARAWLDAGDQDEARYWLLQSLSQPLTDSAQREEFCHLACELGLAAAAMPVMTELIAQRPFESAPLAARFAVAGHEHVAVTLIEALTTVSDRPRDAALDAWSELARCHEARGDAEKSAEAWSVCVALGDRERAGSEFCRLVRHRMTASAALVRAARLRRFGGEIEALGNSLAVLVERTVHEQIARADTTAPADAVALAQWCEPASSAVLLAFAGLLREAIDAATVAAGDEEATALARALSAVAPGDALAAAVLSGTAVRSDEAAIPHLRTLAFLEPRDERQVEIYLGNLRGPRHRETGLRDAKLILHRNPASRAARDFLAGSLNGCLVQGA